MSTYVDISRHLDLTTNLGYALSMGAKLDAVMSILRDHPDTSDTFIMEKLPVTRQTIWRAKKELERLEDEKAKASASSDPASSLPAPVPERINYFSTEEKKTELAKDIGQKIGMIAAAMTPEKAAKSSFKDLAISMGVLIDKQQKINDSGAGAVGILAAALCASMARQMKSIKGPAAVEKMQQAIDVTAAVVTDVVETVVEVADDSAVEA